MKIHVKPQLIEEMKGKLSIGVPNEKLAWAIAEMADDKLFEVQY